MDALEQAYADAAEVDVFFVEYESMPAAAGDLRDLTELAATANPPVSPAEMLDDLRSNFMGAIVDLCVLGTVKGTDRAANCRSALEEFLKARERGIYPKVVAVREKLGLPVSGLKNLGTF